MPCFIVQFGIVVRGSYQISGVYYFVTRRVAWDDNFGLNHCVYWGFTAAVAKETYPLHDSWSLLFEPSCVVGDLNDLIGGLLAYCFM